MGRYRLAIVVPARNEEKTIKKVIDTLKEDFCEEIEVLVNKLKEDGKNTD